MKTLKHCLEDVFYKSLHTHKQFGKYIFDEMAIIPAFNQFSNKEPKLFNSESDNIFEREGWEHFKNFLKEIQKKYPKMTFSRIIEVMEELENHLWEKLSEKEQYNIKILAKKLDDIKI